MVTSRKFSDFPQIDQATGYDGETRRVKICHCETPNTNNLCYASTYSITVLLPNAITFCNCKNTTVQNY